MLIDDVEKELVPYVVEINGEVQTVLNFRMVKARGLDTPENLKILKDLHVQRILLEKDIKNKSLEEIKDFLEKWKQIQFQLQEAWKFSKDENFHRFFDISACSCSKDLKVASHNMMRYPNGNYIYSKKCKLHKHLATSE